MMDEDVKTPENGKKDCEYIMRDIKVDELINSSYKASNAELAEFRCESEDIGIPIISKEVESFFYTVFQTGSCDKVMNVLEIGSATGYSTAILADIFRNAEILTIERSQIRADIARENFKKLNIYDRIEVYVDDAERALEEIIEENRSFDFIFIDAAKSKYMEFFKLCEQLIRKGTVLVCDNILQKGMTVDIKYDRRRKYKTSIRKMRAFLNYILNNENFDVRLFSVGDGLAVCYVKGEDIRRL